MKKTHYTEHQIEESLKSARGRFKLSETEKATMKFNLMDVINSSDSRTVRHNIYNPKRFAMPFIPLIIAALFVSSSATVALADSAKPGDALYSVDLWAESIQAKFATDNDAKARLLANTNQERLNELLALTAESSISAKSDDRLSEHKAEALARLTANAERLDALKAKFEAKAVAATDPKEKEAFTKIADRIAEFQVQMQNRLQAEEPKLDQVLTQGQINLKSGKPWWKVVTTNAQVNSEIKADLETGDDSGSDNSLHKGKLESELKAIFKNRFDGKNDDNEEIKDGYKYSNNSLIQSGWNKVEPVEKPEDHIVPVEVK